MFLTPDKIVARERESCDMEEMSRSRSLWSVVSGLMIRFPNGSVRGTLVIPIYRKDFVGWKVLQSCIIGFEGEVEIFK